MFNRTVKIFKFVLKILIKLFRFNDVNTNTLKTSCSIYILHATRKSLQNLEAETLHETTNIVKHYHHRLRYHQTKTSTQTSAKSRVEGKTEAFRFTNKSEANMV